jgi:hypothetical protein
MDGGERVERLWLTRLRWRMRGAWLWPTFLALTLADAVLLCALPPYGQGAGGLVPGLLLAGFANLFLVAGVAPLVGRRLRRRRPDLPLSVASNYGGTWLLCALGLVILAAGIAHRPAVAGEESDQRAQVAAVQTYLRSSAPDYLPALPHADYLRVQEDLYRTCVPGPDPRRWLCLYVNTAQTPPGVTPDRDRTPNAALRAGGF